MATLAAFAPVRIASFLAVDALFALPVSLASAHQAAAPQGDVVAGKKLYKANCGSCHTLKAAGTVARKSTRGVSFDTKRETFNKVFKVLVQGEGDMLPFTDRLTFKQLKDVAAFVDVSTKRQPGQQLLKRFVGGAR